MANHSLLLDDIRIRCRTALRTHGHTGETMSNYQRWITEVITFMETNNLCEYTPEVGKALMESVKYDSSRSACSRNNCFKAIKLLNFILDESGITPLRKPGRTEFVYADSFAETIESYISYSKGIRSEDALYSHKKILSRFSVRMALEGITPKDISWDKIVKFFGNYDGKQSLYAVSVLKHFCWYLHHVGILQEDISHLFKGLYRAPKHVKLISYYTPSEVKSIEEQIDRSTAKGKRDYAMILLASRLGLRTSDIINLQFSHIDWDKNLIHLVQYKTHRELTLPLLPEIGDAIIDYIQNGRPCSTIKRIFITHLFPYAHVTKLYLHKTVSNYINEAGILVEGRKHGAHALRHSLATAMLNNGETLSTISGVLGHASSESTMAYLTVDINSLILCSHDVPNIDNAFYKQSGGIFFDYE